MMYLVSAAEFVAYTGTFTAPTERMARSATHHSYLLGENSATFSPDLTPLDSR
jgi:hypothetical protein